MLAAWYERRGPADKVLKVDEITIPDIRPDEVLVRVEYSVASPGDVKKRSGWQGSPMPYPRVIPHSDGLGRIIKIGSEVRERSVGMLVWIYGAQSYRPFGTAGEFVVVPPRLTVVLPDDVSESLKMQAATLGIPGITGYRAISAAGGLTDKAVLIYGAARGVGSIAAQMAHREGAEVFAVVRRSSDLEAINSFGYAHAIDSAKESVVDKVRELAPRGIDVIADVDLASNIEVNAEIAAIGATISSYYSSADPLKLPYWKLGFKDITLKFLGSDDFLDSVKMDAANNLTNALLSGELKINIGRIYKLEEIAKLHEEIEKGAPLKPVLKLNW